MAVAYTKNGDPATQPIPGDLAEDLRDYAGSIAPDDPVFPLTPDCGAKMLRPDPERAGIPYRDASGRVFNFHSPRCQCATLLDAEGVLPASSRR